MELSKIFNHAPSFKSWVENKKLNSKELTVLTEFSGFHEVQDLIDWIVQCQPSHSQGAQILELGGELLLAGKSISSLTKKEQNPKTLLKKLKILRYPLASQKDKNKEQEVKQLPWSSLMQGKWIRQGDQSGLEVSFKSFSLKDLENKIKTLETIKNFIKTNKKIWKK